VHAGIRNSNTVAAIERLFNAAVKAAIVWFWASASKAQEVQAVHADDERPQHV